MSVSRNTYRRAQFADRDILRNTEQHTVILAPNWVSDLVPNALYAWCSNRDMTNGPLELVRGI